MARPTPSTHRHAVLALAVVYLGLLVWVVLWKLEVPHLGWRELYVKLVPFVRVAGYGASAPGEVLANVALFLPLGVYARLLGPSWRWWGVATAGAALSLALEVTQAALRIGSADSTDVLANAAGALVGLGLATLVQDAWGEREGARALTHLGAVTTALVLVSFGAGGLGPR